MGLNKKRYIEQTEKKSSFSKNKEIFRKKQIIFPHV